MHRRAFIAETALGATALLSLGRPSAAAAAQWTPLEAANVKVVNEFIAARVALRNSGASNEEFDRKMTEYTIDNLMFTVHAVGNFVPMAKIPAGRGPFSRIEMKIGETFAKGPIVMHERVDVMSFPNQPDRTGRLIGVFALKDGKIHEWLEYSY
jgi:limonene-1,2-epoxide hydrolase